MSQNRKPMHRPEFAASGGRRSGLQGGWEEERWASVIFLLARQWDLGELHFI